MTALRRGRPVRRGNGPRRDPGRRGVHRELGRDRPGRTRRGRVRARRRPPDPPKQHAVSGNTAASNGGGRVLLQRRVAGRWRTARSSGNAAGGADGRGRGSISSARPTATPPAGFVAGSLVIRNSTLANNISAGGHAFTAVDREQHRVRTAAAGPPRPVADSEQHHQRDTNSAAIVRRTGGSGRLPRRDIRGPTAGVHQQIVGNTATGRAAGDRRRRDRPRPRPTPGRSPSPTPSSPGTPTPTARTS